MTNQNEPNARIPTHTIYVVEVKEGSNKSDWLKVGVAWEHSDADGMNLSINTLGAAYLQARGQEAILTVRRNTPQH